MTIATNIKYFKLDFNSNKSKFNISTNILKIDNDYSNLDNRKVFFILDGDYNNKLSYMYVDNGIYKFRHDVPNCNKLIVLIQKSIIDQYECYYNVGEFYIDSIIPENGTIEVETDTIITINTNRKFNELDLNSTIVYLQKATTPLTGDNAIITGDNAIITGDQTEIEEDI